MMTTVNKTPTGSTVRELACALANGMHTAAQQESFAGMDLNCVPWCVDTAVKLMNSHAKPNLGTLFTMTYQALQDPTQHNTFLTYEINISCVNSINPAYHAGVTLEESIVSKLELLFTQVTESKVDNLNPHTKLSVKMIKGGTVLCVQKMHLATLLRACALLCAQLLAYLGTPEEKVLFSGAAISIPTIKIYTKLFSDLESEPTQSSLLERFDPDKYEVLDLYSYVSNPGSEIPQSAINVSRLIVQSKRDSGDMCHAPFPQQIKDRKRKAIEQPRDPHGQGSACTASQLCVRQYTHSPVFYVPLLDYHSFVCVFAPRTCSIPNVLI